MIQKLIARSIKDLHSRCWLRNRTGENKVIMYPPKMDVSRTVMAKTGPSNRLNILRNWPIVAVFFLANWRPVSIFVRLITIVAYSKSRRKKKNKICRGWWRRCCVQTREDGQQHTTTTVKNRCCFRSCFLTYTYRSIIPLDKLSNKFSINIVHFVTQFFQLIFQHTLINTFNDVYIRTHADIYWIFEYRY